MKVANILKVFGLENKNKCIKINNDDICLLHMHHRGETKKSCFSYLDLKHMLIIIINFMAG